MNKFEIIDMAMRIAGHSIRDSEWEAHIAFALINTKAIELGDQLSLRDIAQIEVKAKNFQAEFDHWKIEKNKTN